MASRRSLLLSWLHDINLAKYDSWWYCSASVLLVMPLPLSPHPYHILHVHQINEAVLQADIQMLKICFFQTLCLVSIPTIGTENGAFFDILYNAGNNCILSDNITVYLKITCVTHYYVSTRNCVPNNETTTMCSQLWRSMNLIKNVNKLMWPHSCEHFTKN